MNGVGTQHVQETEYPAPPALLLVADFGVDVELVGEGGVQRVRPLGVDEGLGQRRVGDGVHSDLLGGVG